MCFPSLYHVFLSQKKTPQQLFFCIWILLYWYIDMHSSNSKKRLDMWRIWFPNLQVVSKFISGIPKNWIPKIQGIGLTPPPTLVGIRTPRLSLQNYAQQAVFGANVSCVNYELDWLCCPLTSRASLATVVFWWLPSTSHTVYLYCHWVVTKIFWSEPHVPPSQCGLKFQFPVFFYF